MKIQERAPHPWISDDALFKDNLISRFSQIFSSFFKNLRGQIEDAKVPTDICIDGFSVVNFTRVQQNHISRRDVTFGSIESESLAPRLHQCDGEGVVPVRNVGMLFVVSGEQFDPGEVWPARDMSLFVPGTASIDLHTAWQLEFGVTFHRRKPSSSMD